MLFIALFSMCMFFSKTVHSHSIIPSQISNLPISFLHPVLWHIFPPIVTFIWYIDQYACSFDCCFARGRSTRQAGPILQVTFIGTLQLAFLRTQVTGLLVFVPSNNGQLLWLNENECFN